MCLWYQIPQDRACLDMVKRNMKIVFTYQKKKVAIDTMKKILISCSISTLDGAKSSQLKFQHSLSEWLSTRTDHLERELNLLIGSLSPG